METVTDIIKRTIAEGREKLIKMWAEEERKIYGERKGKYVVDKWRVRRLRF